MDQDIADNQLQRVESFQYPSGHLGHLSQTQEDALEAFKSLCAKQKYYTPEGNGQRASHDDETMLRYLRARKFVPKDAFTQFKDTEDWRKKNDIDGLYNHIDTAEYNETRKLYPQWTGRRDKRGIPVYVFEVASLTSKRMAEYEKSTQSSTSAQARSKDKDAVPPKLVRLFALYENLVRFVLPFCAALPDRPHAETPVSQSNNIVDISNVGLKQFWNLKDHMQLASQLATAHYPETLDRIFIIGAPSFFPTVWGWIKRWFDPITVSKIFILGQREMKSTLERYIDSDNIPKKYGGRLDWAWGELPNLDPAMDNALEWKKPSKDGKGRHAFPAGPVKWQRTPQGDMVAIAVGNEHGKHRNDTIAILRAHERELKLATVLSPTDYEADPPSTSGLYTHPTDSSNHVSQGSAPAHHGMHSNHNEPALDPRVGTRQQTPPSVAGASHVLPVREVGHSTTSTASQPRTGTSTTRYVQQEGTHAQGQMGHGTPSTLHHGYGDKTSTVEPATVGQARKDVHLPDAQPAESDNDASYLEQAKVAASSVYTTALSAVGLGGAQAEATENGDAKAQHAHAEVPSDPRVDQMENKDVEEFIRSRYTTHGNHGKGS